MNYFKSIKIAFIIFPLVALLFSYIFIFYQYHKYKSINIFKIIIIYSFILYLTTIYLLVILPLPDKNTVTYKDNMIRLIPFGFINSFLKETSFNLSKPATYLKAIKEPCFYTLIFNIFMTIPLGMYLSLLFKCNLKKVVFISFCLSLFLEITQVTGLYHIYKYPYRVFDVDDLITNTLGGLIGYYIMKFLPINKNY